MLKTNLSISNAFDSIVITRNDVSRVYDSFIPTAGQSRLYDFLKTNADRFDVRPYTETVNGITITATASKVWTLKS